MLQSLYISNYALIDKLSINFHSGFNIITGETGAGKSIILGALGLMLGQRADLNVLLSKEKKCLVEGSFNIKGYHLELFFEQEELDYEDETIIRREISPSGKTRAFINDTPVNLKVLRSFALNLIDIHSQHQNLELASREFQLNLVDLVAENKQELDNYSILFGELQRLRKQLFELIEESEKASADLDYFKFQFQQLDEANLQESEQEELETELKTLEHAEEIKYALGQLSDNLEGEEFGFLSRIKSDKNRIASLFDFLPAAKDLSERLESVYLELKDIADEASSTSENVEFNPERITFVNDRLNLLYSLQQKFHVDDVVGLLQLKDEFDEKIQKIDSSEDEINELKKEIESLNIQVNEQASFISERRKNVASKIEDIVIEVIQKLGMKNAAFHVNFEKLAEAGKYGIDDVSFLFSANKNSVPQEISKVASGGEISRLMLALKSLMTNSNSLPTIIFDEIDTGVSGEVAIKMGDILRELSSKMQVINITHLPQIAAKGQHHYKVYKFDEGDRTYTSIRQLTDDERIEELALMLGGEQASDRTRETARELLN